EEVRPSCRLVTQTRPSNRVIEEIAGVLRSAASPVIVVGDGVANSGASKEVERLAATLGAEVWGANSSEVNISAASPFYCGTLGHMFGFQSEPHTRSADAVLI